jgi:D-amino-acid dehydrogenase
MKVCVIGAGVVGCATAYELCRAGHKVTLLDAAPEPGSGASFANGAQLSYRFVEPLANPGTLMALPRLLVRRDSPLRFRLRLDPAQWAWGLQFLRACAPARARSGAQRLAALGRLSEAVLDRWMGEESLAFGWRRNGKLLLCPDRPSWERQQRQVRLLDRADEQVLLDRQACLRREPALAGAEPFWGGVWTPGECAGDPAAYCRSLVAALLRRGGQARFGTPVLGLERAGSRARAALTPQGPVAAQAFVLAAGLAGRRLAGTWGETLPLYPVKGYSLTLRLRPGRFGPRTNVTHLGRKMVLAPLGDYLRVAATADVVGEDTRLPPDRIAAIVAGVEAVYPGLCELSDPQALGAWAGLRPMTPDSLPIVRRAQLSNVWLNVGHGALGFTLAAGCARLVREALAATPPAP